jgi:hypothetical protein
LDPAAGQPVSATRVWLVGLLAALVALTGLMASPAAASTLTPCPKPPPPPAFEGEGTLVASGVTKKLLRNAGVSQRILRPGNAFVGRPTFPLSSAGISASASGVTLGGGVKLIRRDTGRGVEVRSMKLVVRRGQPLRVTARVAGRRVNLFTAGRARLKVDVKDGVLRLNPSRVRLTRSGSRAIRGGLGLRAAALAPGRIWGAFSAFAFRNEIIDDPEAETPVPPPLLERPAGASDVVSASIKWRVRESFIRYVNVGTGTSVADGATADPAEDIGGAGPLVYSFNFPFSSGWTVPGGDTAIYGTGTVGFRHCRNTINFTVSDPEIELKDSGVSRLIFRVNGTDGTAFPDSRAVMVDLLPAAATVDGDTTTYTNIPAYVPQEATGIFANFYPPYPGDPNAPNADLSRFGSMTLSYTTG